ncbi:MAG: peptidase C14 [Symploca sp. SIO2G7]|nr:peptidase C14 [Symploca sp. SIO2G7]
MGLNRRNFLQKAGLGLAALGVSETVLSLLGAHSLAVPLFDRYFQVLAQPSGRKLALLVGINKYPGKISLAGCLTDVELQKELLIHRFGFKARDILTLTDSQANREDIETAFVEHLTKQAKAGDVVVFHFSGYGSRLQSIDESHPNNPPSIQNSWVPVDGALPKKSGQVANYLLEETLVLLLRSLATDQVTTVLDTSYTNLENIVKGNLRVRSYPHSLKQKASLEELAFQEQIRVRFKPASEQWQQAKMLRQLPAVVLAAASSDEVAMEAPWDGFSAGLFTYALTQYLWQATPATTIQTSLSSTAGTVGQIAARQQPQLISKKSPQRLLLNYYLPTASSMGADGVVTAVEDNGKTAQLWLAGLPAMVIGYYSNNSLLKINSAASSLQLQIRSKEGLTAKAKLVSASVGDNEQLEVGQLVQEAVRVLPHNLGLTIALDPNLQRIERVDATSAFAGISSVSSVMTTSEQPADYLFGQVLAVNTADLSNTDLSVKKEDYGLFHLSGDLIRNTTGATGEAVKSAVNRLTNKLDTLLAAKLLRLTANEGSSRLGVRASLEVVSPEPRLVIQRETWRASSSIAQCPPWCDLSTGNEGVTTPSVSTQPNTDYSNLKLGINEGSIPTLERGNHIKYRLENYSDQPVYFMMLGFDTSSNAIALYQIQSLEVAGQHNNKPTLKEGMIPPGATLTIPHNTATFDWTISGLPGIAEIQLVCSLAPFPKAIEALQVARRPQGTGERIGDLFHPLPIVQALLQDLHDASAVASEVIGSISDNYALDVNAWATLSFIYQVV